MQRCRKRHVNLKFIIILIFCLMLLVVAPSFAQDLGDVARKDRAREKAQPPQHVYTNEDLARPRILLPQDRARFEAERKAPGISAEPQTATGAAPMRNLNELPLGDVARYYRLQKQLRQLEEMGNLPGLGDLLGLARPSAAAPSIPERTSPKLSRVIPRTVVRSPKRRAPASSNRVRVAKGDSLWKFAERVLGNGKRWPELAALNPQIKNPDLLRVGDWLQLPGKISTQENPTQVRVHSGDTLWHLAQASFGTGFAWTCVAQANPDLHNPDRIYPGQALNIPPTCSVVH